MRELELNRKPDLDSGWDRNSGLTHAGEELELALRITDPELLAELSAYPEGRARAEFALSALRIGVLALRQVRGRIDADVIRSESERLIAEFRKGLTEHQQAVTLQLTSSLKEYFDPSSGRFNERVERLVRKDGELEALMQRQVGLEDSELGKTLSAHFGERSPLMKLLSPDESRGLLRSLGHTLEQGLTAQRERILKEFSLDNKEGALSRLVTELAESHGKLSKDLQGSIAGVVGEFSLDDEQSALSRLVRRVEQAQSRISREFSLDEESSALARMKRELLDVLNTHKEASAKFREEVMTVLSAMTARREEAQRSTSHGTDFEAELFRFLQAECQKAGEVATHVGNTTGRIKNCKVGDCLVELGPESAAAGARIVIEAKESSGYNLAQALEEIERGRKNRDAGVGIFVFSIHTAPEGLEPLARYGNDVVVTWDANEPRSDVFFTAALSIARALSTRAAAQREAREADFESIDRAVREVEKQTRAIEEITRFTGTIKSHSEKILERARIMQEALREQVRTLDEKIGDLKTVLAPEKSATPR